MEQVFNKTIDSLQQSFESIQGKQLNENLEQVIKSIIEETRKKNEEIVNTQKRVNFLTEILELKKQSNLYSSASLRELMEQKNRLEEENKNFYIDNFNQKAIDNPVGINEKSTEDLENFHMKLNQCFNFQVCLDCLNTKF